MQVEETPDRQVGCVAYMTFALTCFHVSPLRVRSIINHFLITRVWAFLALGRSVEGGEAAGGRGAGSTPPYMLLSASACNSNKVEQGPAVDPKLVLALLRSIRRAEHCTGGVPPALGAQGNASIRDTVCYDAPLRGRLRRPIVV